MRVLEVQWPWALSLVCEVALNHKTTLKLMRITKFVPQPNAHMGLART